MDQPPPALKTRNLAIVFTDIQGFTARTSQQTHEENQRLLRQHQALLAPLFRAFGGKVIKTIGDSFLVTFESPTQSVLCGVAIQDRLWIHNQSVPEAERLHVRVAINAGEVRLEQNDIFGEPVNIAARVEGIAEAGSVTFTEAVYLSMNKAEVPAEEWGVHELKGIPDKVQLFRVPQAPYRTVPGEVAERTSDQPPFGNLGLSRMGDWASAQEKAYGYSARALELGSTAFSSATQAVQRAMKTAPLHKRSGALALGCAGLLLLGWGAYRYTGVRGAIGAVARASEEERPARVEEAKKRISALSDEEGERSYFLGQLEEAEGKTEDAIARYRAAARHGHSGARSRIVDLLESPNCEVRQSAAWATGELRLKEARSDLEAILESDSAEESPIPIFGCNPKRAAKFALERIR